MKINKTPHKIRAYAAGRRQKKKRLAAVACLAVMAVFCTTSRLVMPAYALEKNQRLTCTYALHQHGGGCYDGEGRVTCGYAGYAVHTHDPAYCYDEDHDLVCPLEETAVHKHSTACYGAEGVLTCGRDEVILHTHTEDCYENILNESGAVIGRRLACGLLQVEKHQHNAGCLTVSEKTDANVIPLKTPDIKISDTEPVDGETPDTGTPGEGTPDTETADMGTPDAGTPDAGTPDTGTPDTGTSDTEPTDTETPDTKTPDTETSDTETPDTETSDTETTDMGTSDTETVDTETKEQDADSAALAVSEEAGTGDSSTVPVYIDHFSIKKVLDGSEPFDATGERNDGGIDTPGNDKGPENRVVRSFDSIEYDMGFSITTRDSEATLNSAQIGFELSLFKGATAAEFNTKDMSWLEDGWQIEYLDNAGKVILIKDSSGLYEWDNDNHQKGAKTSLNGFVNGSQGDNAYLVNNGIVQQKLTGTYTIHKENGETLAGAEQGLTAFINVLAASNKESFEPTFRVWLVGNEDNLDADGKPSSANEINIAMNNTETQQYVVMVSAAARYNVLVKNSGATNYLGYFDFSTGQKVEKANETAAYGRMLSWGITLQLYNETDNEEKGALASKGYRGIELPVNGISFDLTLTSSVKGGDSQELTESNNFSPYLWDYHANDTSGSGTWGRNLYWGNNDRTQYAKSVAPYNNSGTKVSKYGNGTNYCYHGGTWTLTGYTVDDNPGDTKKTSLSSASKTGSGTVYSFSVSGYDFDFDNFLTQFPSSASGDSGVSSLLTAPAYSFSAGHVQVFQRFDENYNGEFTAYVKAEVSNLQAASKTNKTAKEVNLEDNKEQISVVKYRPGDYAKYISFTDRAANDENSRANKFNFSGRNYFLGGSDLETRSDDASAYAGSDIYMFSRGYRTSGDGYINAINFLQKFDSRVLSIDTGVTDAKLDNDYGTADEKQPWFAWYVGFSNATANAEGKNPGTATWLYAADPLWPEGYDTNSSEKRSFTKNGVTYDYTAAQRMAFAQEEDLIYFSSMDDLKTDRYTCIGVLMEVRNCSLEAGSNYPTMRVAMKVSSDAANIGNTVSTTAVVRNWIDDGGSMQSISWKNGSANTTVAKEGGQTVANTLTGKDDQKLTDLTDYGKCVAQTHGSGPDAGNLYIKSEYNNGSIVTHTHFNGYTWGMSLLVIGYKSYLDIGVKNIRDDNPGGDTGNQVFEIDKGEWTAEYTISNIHTETTSNTSQSSTTNLKLDVTVPVESGVGKDDGLTMITSSFKIGTTDDEGKPAYTGIGTGETNATEFKFTYGGKEYKCQVYVNSDSDGKASIYLKGVPIGVNLPDIVFDAEIGSKVGNNADLTVTAAISGDQDTRAQTADNGNYVTETIRISTLSSSSLVKKVQEVLTELDGKIHYTIAYSNTSTQSAIGKMYLYDLMPYNKDIRSSKFDGNVKATEISAYLSDSSGNTSGVEFEAYARFYYSTVAPEILKSILGQKDFDNLPDTNGIYLQALLDNALVDDAGNVYFFLDGSGKICNLYEYSNTGGNNEQITGTNFTVDNTSRRVESVSVAYTSFVQVSGVTIDGNSNIVLTSTSKNFESDTYKKMFRHYGYLDGSSQSTTITPGQGASAPGEFDSATCIFARVINLGSSRTLNIGITIETDENAAGNIYGNKAHSTIVGNTTSQLSSNTVKTRVVSREISGLVWYDANRDGVRGDNEKLLDGVACTLFKKDDSGNWEKCTSDVTGKEISSVTTGTDGAYAFAGLAEGTYVVAFKNAEGSTVLNKFTGATTYQAGRAAADINNDGQAVTDSQTGLSGYAYYISYKMDSSGNVTHIPLSSLDSIADSAAFDKNACKEICNHLDLGLVAASLSIDKVSENGSSKLTGAKFLLYRDDNGTKSYYACDSGTDTTMWVPGEQDAEVLTTEKDGKYAPVSVHWLTAGTYYLSETAAPDGYHLLTGPVEITVSPDGSVTVKYEDKTYGPDSTEKTGWKVAFEEITDGNYAWKISVPNSAGYELPDTGGSGTTLYITGGLLLITAAVLILLYRRKRCGKGDMTSS